jgi:hypothetical protein
MAGKPGEGEGREGRLERWAEAEREVPRFLDRLEGTTELPPLRREMAELLAALEEHFHEEEGPGGFFDQLRQVAPRADARLKGLAAEHAEILAGLRHLAAALESCRDPAEAQRLAAEKDALLRRLRAHSRAEADLIEDTWLR